MKMSLLPSLPSLPKIRPHNRTEHPSPPKLKPPNTKVLSGLLPEKTNPSNKPTDLDLSNNELSFSSLSPIRRKKEPVIIESSIEMVEKVEEELSALRPKNPHLYPEPNPNELYSERTK